MHLLELNEIAAIEESVKKGHWNVAFGGIRQDKALPLASGIGASERGLDAGANDIGRLYQDGIFKLTSAAVAQPEYLHRPHDSPFAHIWHMGNVSMIPINDIGIAAAKCFALAAKTLTLIMKISISTGGVKSWWRSF